MKKIHYGDDYINEPCTECHGTGVLDIHVCNHIPDDCTNMCTKYPICNVCKGEGTVREQIEYIDFDYKVI